MNEKSQIKAHKGLSKDQEVSSRIPGFYRLPVERRLVYLARSFNLTDEQVTQLRDGRTLRVEHAVNMVENAFGVLGMPLGLGLNFLVNGHDYLVPMVIEEASIIAAASKAALMIRKGGGFHTEVDEPVMIGQIQVLDLDDPVRAAQILNERKEEIIEQANLSCPLMVQRGGGAFDIETRIFEAENNHQAMLIVHLLYNVQEAMGANSVNSACEAAGPVIEKITGGRVNLRILSNLADHRIAKAEFSLPYKYLATDSMSGEEVAGRLLEADRMAWVDPYRATTHNKGIFNGIGAAALALGQDWRAIEAGGHAYAARDGQYRSLTRFSIEGDSLKGEIKLPLQVGWVGGAVNSHPGFKILRQISGVQNSKELASLLASVGLGQNFAACLALSTVGIQKGHMALHARSIALSVGASANDVEEVAQEMISRSRVQVEEAESIYKEILKKRELRKKLHHRKELLVETSSPGKVVLFGEHATVYNLPGITAAIDINLNIQISRDLHGPRFLNPHFKQPFDVPKSDQDIRLFSRAVDVALSLNKLEHESIAIQIESDLVPGMGLGSSAAFSAALCKALHLYKGEDIPHSWSGSLFNEVQQLESIFHGHPSGMDAATVLSDGVIWFRKGPPREILPIRLREDFAGIICMVEPGARTIELVKQVRRSRDLNRKRVDNILDEIGTLTVDAGIALGTGDVEEVGKLMFRNHELLARLGVSTPALDNSVEKLLDLGVYGAKLTGSGGGGAIIALVDPDMHDDLVKELSNEFAMVFPFTLGASL
ncbi:MAG: hydroxymethylglutaryl-CoA reductase, degradative [Candidatus Electryonea clarkiae]|nr:hydroxymethylglutaryl-CoA reductase, degradative [Candidatus Electryonea clarkiae]MDP8288799.1 hydroxymethylglutaryl-CoA reductase, degradative [Candidatus Electryonea clarkiae]